MDIKKVTIHNFLTIGDAEIELDNRGLLLIQGENKDDSSATSNGSGKSSIVDAISWCLFGVTARGKSGDGVVNRFAKKDCYVRIDLQDGSDLYYIDRHRKSTVHKNQLFVSKEITPGSMTNISKGTEKETQALLHSIIGSSADVFNAAIYFGQEKMPDLPAMTDKNLKLLIEEAAGVEVLNKAYDIARVQALAAKASLEATNILVANLKKSQVATDEELTQAKLRQKEFEDGRSARAKSVLAGILPYQKDIAALNDTIFKTDQPALLKELAECKTKIAAQDEERKKLAKLEADYNGLARMDTMLTTQLDAGKKTLRALADSLAKVDERVGKPCGECGKTYCEHDLDAARKAAAAAVEAEKERLRPILTRSKEVKQSMDAAGTAVDFFRSGMTDISAVVARQNELAKALNNYDMQRQRVVALSKEVDGIKALAAQKLKEKNPFDELVMSLTDRLGKIAGEGGDAAVKVATCEEELVIAEDAVKVFGPAGVRAHILDTVTPFLNDRTREYLGALSDGNIHAVWTTLTKTAKGDLKEKFSIEASNDKGDDTFDGLSGGEKRKVRLATAMALQDLVATRAAKPINLLIADEVDHALDEAGLERLMGLLENKAKERGTVLVISHNSLADWCDQIITVSKEAGVSTVSGDTKSGTI